MGEEDGLPHADHKEVADHVHEDVAHDGRLVREDPLGFEQKRRVCILSDKVEELRSYILSELHSGATIYDAIGAYDMKPRRELVVIVDKHGSGKAALGGGLLLGEHLAVPLDEELVGLVDEEGLMNAEFYTGNRKKFLEKLDEGSVVLLHSGILPVKSNDQNMHPFSVNRNFYYLTGIETENVWLVLTKTATGSAEALFIDQPDEFLIKWNGTHRAWRCGASAAGPQWSHRRPCGCRRPPPAS